MKRLNVISLMVKKSSMCKHYYLTFMALLILSCQANTVEFVLQPGFVIEKSDKKSILQIAKEVGFDSIYQIEIGIFGKYDSSRAIVVKQVAFANDTLQKEKWLYVWRREWTNSQFFRSFGDSSIIRGDFLTGKKCVRSVNKYVFKYGDRKKMFQFANSKGSFEDVKMILDCILSGTTIEDKMGFKEEAGKDWDYIKENVLEFKSVTFWGKHYSFEYEFPQLKHPCVGFNAKRNGDSCEIISFSWVGSCN